MGSCCASACGAGSCMNLLCAAPPGVMTAPEPHMCRLVNIIKPGSVKSINTVVKPFKCMVRCRPPRVQPAFTHDLWLCCAGKHQQLSQSVPCTGHEGV